MFDARITSRGCERHAFELPADAKHVSTSFAEDQNLTMRMHMRRFARLTNGFSKKVEAHTSAVALRFMYYNFVRIHASLRLGAGNGHWCHRQGWEIADIVALIKTKEAEKPVVRGLGGYLTFSLGTIESFGA